MKDFLLPDMFQESGFRYLCFVTPIVIGCGLAGAKFIEQYFSFHEAAERIE